MKEIIQKNGKYWKECDIVMLPTKGELQFAKKGSSLSPAINMYRFNGILKGIQQFYHNKELNPLFNTLSLCGIENKEHNIYDANVWQPQNLYILSNEQINEGDEDYFVYNTKDNVIGLLTEAFKNVNQPSENITSFGFNMGKTKEVNYKVHQLQCIGFQNQASITHCKKIIASTDKSLRLLEHEFSSKTIELPSLSEDFIKKYVESNGSIKKVLVEYDRFSKDIDYSKGTCKESDLYHHKVKLNPDNTINILIEDSVEEAAEKFALENVNFGEKYAFIKGAEWQKNNSSKIACDFLEWFVLDKDEEVTKLLTELPAHSTTKEIFKHWQKNQLNN